jgi:hypothetical protein
MYSIDDRDSVRELADLPQLDVGSPRPIVLASEGILVLAYFLHDPPHLIVGHDVVPADEPAAFVRFGRPRAHMFGPPNDEAFAGHPLAGRGLHPYAAFEVLNSSWIRGLERMNSVHPAHRPAAYARLRHFVWAFHDSVFECVAEAYKLELASGPLTNLIANAAHEMD